MPYVVAVDQGTTGSTVLVFDRLGRVVGRAYSEFTQHYPRPGWVEHDAEEIWQVTLRVLRQACRRAGARGRDIRAHGITTQRETTVLWSRRTGRPVHRAIVWQDRRTAPLCEELRARGLEARVRQKTGLVLDPYFSGSKLRWLLDNVARAAERAAEGELCFGTIDSWLVWKLSGGPAYALEGSVFIAGAAIQWLRDGLGLVKRAAESERLAKSVDSTLGVYLVPAFVGLGAPHWDAGARGALLGLTRGVTRAHVVRAALEALAYQTRDVADAMAADAGAPLRWLRVDGGASANDFLMQFQADVLGVPVDRPRVVETTAMGAAFLAGLATGFWRSQAELARARRIDRRFRPRMAAAKRDALYRGWRDAVTRVRSTPAPA